MDTSEVACLTRAFVSLGKTNHASHPDMRQAHEARNVGGPAPSIATERAEEK